MTAGRLALRITLADDCGSSGFDALVAEHQPLVLRTAWRLLGNPEDARDAAQEVFLRLFRHRERVGPDPRAWLYRVTVNVCNDQHRRRIRVCELDPGIAATVPDPELTLKLEQRKKLLVQGLSTLSDRERAAVVLRDIEGLSTAEVASIMEVGEVTVRGHVHSARVKLAKYVRRRQ